MAAREDEMKPTYTTGHCAIHPASTPLKLHGIRSIRPANQASPGKGIRLRTIACTDAEFRYVAAMLAIRRVARGTKALRRHQNRPADGTD